jgi:hypothetical protein
MTSLDLYYNNVNNTYPATTISGRVLIKHDMIINDFPT